MLGVVLAWSPGGRAETSRAEVLRYLQNCVELFREHQLQLQLQLQQLQLQQAQQQQQQQQAQQVLPQQQQWSPFAANVLAPVAESEALGAVAAEAAEVAAAVAAVAAMVASEEEEETEAEAETELEAEAEAGEEEEEVVSEAVQRQQIIAKLIAECGDQPVVANDLVPLLRRYVRASGPELRAAAERQLARQSSTDGAQQTERGVAAAFDAVIDEVEARRASSRDRAVRADNPPDRDTRHAGGGGSGRAGAAAVTTAATATAAVAAAAAAAAGTRRGVGPAAPPLAPRALHAARPDVLLLYMGSVLYGQLLLLDGQARNVACSPSVALV